MEFACYKCGQKIVRTSRDPIGRSEECDHCRTDVRVCKNCRHFDSSARWECREHISEAVREKERGNFCDFFQVRELSAGINPLAKAQSGRDDLLKAAEALFKKK